MSYRSINSQNGYPGPRTRQSVSFRSQINTSPLESYRILCGADVTMSHGHDMSFSFFFLLFFFFFVFFSFFLFFSFFSARVTEKGEERGKKRRKKEQGKNLNGSHLSVKIMPCHIRVACHINTT